MSCLFLELLITWRNVSHVCHQPRAIVGTTLLNGQCYSAHVSLFWLCILLVWCIIWAFKFCIQVINTKEMFMCLARWLSDAFSFKYALKVPYGFQSICKQTCKHLVRCTAFKFCIQVINTKEMFMCLARWLSDAFSLKYALSTIFTSNYGLKYVHGWW